MTNKEVIKILKAIKGDFEQVFRYSYHDIHLSLEKAIEAIEKEERPQGKWKALDYHTCYCTNCHFDFDIMKCDFMTKMNFCSNCGADMRVKGGRK